MVHFRLLQAGWAKALVGTKIDIYQKNSKFNIVFMEKKNFEILSSNSQDMGRFRLFQASQARALAGSKN